MHHFKRRQFLQLTASALTTLGISQLDIRHQGLRYAKTLANSTPRKLALLVGINSYRDDGRLRGCINDVYLQRELLIHRFGFNPKDIFIVTDDSDTNDITIKNTDIKPTRAGILQAFDEYLIKQIKPGDVAVFHFSGHGSQVFDPESGFDDQLNSTFVPIDRQVKTKGDRSSVSDIMGETLFLLMSALQTENVCVVLDSCHSGGGKRGDLIVRAIEGGKNFDPSLEERKYQEQMLSKLGKTSEWLQTARKQGIAKGMVIASAARDQLAADARFNGFQAGAFTYALTQYLWQVISNETVSSVIANVSRTTTRISNKGQLPEFEVKKNSGNERKATYFLSQQTPPAAAVVTKVEGNTIVLSACDTAQGTITGDGVIGLSRALITVGAPSVIVTLWSIPDSPSALLMSEFYRQLQKNPDKAKALRQAMLITMRQHPHPSAWAAFTLIGESQ